MKLVILDRGLKANFEIRIFNKETKKTKTISIYSESEDEVSLKEEIVKGLKKCQ